MMGGLNYERDLSPVEVWEQFVEDATYELFGVMFYRGDEQFDLVERFLRGANRQPGDVKMAVVGYDYR